MNAWLSYVRLVRRSQTEARRILVFLEDDIRKGRDLPSKVPRRSQSRPTADVSSSRRFAATTPTDGTCPTVVIIPPVVSNVCRRLIVLLVCFP